MRAWRPVIVFIFFISGGTFCPSYFFCSNVNADTITLKNGKDLKGLVLEEHVDRIILGTEKGEIPILRKGIKTIDYDDPAQNFLRVGKSYEEAGKLGPALAYYEKASELNPDLEEARKAVAGVRNRFWTQSTEGPRNEIEKQQVLYDAWGQGRPVDEIIQKRQVEQEKSLREGLGIVLEKKGDWVLLEYVDPKKSAGLVGLKKSDRLVSIDSQSLRFLNTEVVAKMLLFPRYSNCTLEIERDSFLHKGDPKKLTLNELGLKIKLEYQGHVIGSVKKDSIAAAAGLKKRDLLTHVDGAPTRYTSPKKLQNIINDSKEERMIFTVRRFFLLTRS